MKRVLIVEDNRDNLDLLSYAFKRAGHEVIMAGAAEEGVELV